MLEVRPGLWLLPEKLILVEGQTVTAAEVDALRRTDGFSFADPKTPKDAMQEMQDPNQVDYALCFPISGGICVSDKCQLRCKYCAFESAEHNRETVTMEQVKPFVDFLIANLIMRRLVSRKTDEVLDLYLAGGGEPTYAWDRMVQIVEYTEAQCAKHKIAHTFGITTNCILNAEQTDYLRKHFNLITVSFDGLPDVQNKNRAFAGGRGTFEAVNRTLMDFCQTDTPIVMRATIWPEDYKRLTDMVQFVTEHYPNVSYLDVEPINRRGRAAKSDHATVADDFLEHYWRAKQWLGEAREGWLSCGKFKDDIVGFLCGTAYGRNPWLLPNGNIVTCIDAREKAAVVATVQDGTLQKKISQDQLLEAYLKHLDDCRSCFAFRFCGGGCPLNVVNPEEAENQAMECRMIRRYWKMLFEKLITETMCFGWRADPIAAAAPGQKAWEIRREIWKSESV